MIDLALKDYDRNAGVLGYQIIDPSCERYQQLADRGEEYKLQLNGGISRNLCFTHDPSLKAGDYFHQIQNTRKESFEQWTRRKDIGKPYQAKGAPVTDLDDAFFRCWPSTAPGTCAYNDGSKMQYVPCPSQCGVHPTPCPNPVK
jgi:hypothetical protein